MTTRAETGQQSTTDVVGESPPPGAIDRLKRERDEAAAQAAKAAEQATEAGRVAAAALQVDKLYAILKGRETPPPDPYQAAKDLAGFVPEGSEVTAESVDQLLARMASVLPGQQASAAPQPRMPMAGNPSYGGGGAGVPGQGGVTIEEGPFPLRDPNSNRLHPKALEFMGQNRTSDDPDGLRALYRAVANGLFYPSVENAAAQATANQNLLG